MNGWKDGWMVGWMRGWVNGYLSGWGDEQMNEWGLYLKAQTFV